MNMAVMNDRGHVGCGNWHACGRGHEKWRKEQRGPAQARPRSLLHLPAKTSMYCDCGELQRRFATIDSLNSLTVGTLLSRPPCCSRWSPRTSPHRTSTARATEIVQAGAQIRLRYLPNRSRPERAVQLHSELFPHTHVPPLRRPPTRKRGEMINCCLKLTDNRLDKMGIEPMAATRL